MKRCLTLLCLLLACAVQGATLQPLTLASLPQLQARFAGERHAILFWSLSCVPCHAELAELGKTKDVTQLPISLVNTDDPDQADAVMVFLTERHLEKMDNWQFADAIPERLRDAIDADWYGELPRTYVVDANGKRTGHSGKTDLTQLLGWLRQH